jgi:RimJ/RimL family protein N-acetyltransferase
VTPPYRIETARLVVRCWQPTDAAALKDALDSSLDHLRPWLPWARDEPKPLAEKAELLRSFRGMFDLDQDYIYGIFQRDESRVVGGTGLHTRLTDDAREIGYWIRRDAEGSGYMTETVSALLRVGFELGGLGRIEIRCHPDNRRSAAIPERLGFRHVETVDDADGDPSLVYAMDVAGYAGSPATAVDLAAFDVLGERLL